MGANPRAERKAFQQLLRSASHDVAPSVGPRKRVHDEAVTVTKAITQEQDGNETGRDKIFNKRPRHLGKVPHAVLVNKALQKSVVRHKSQLLTTDSKTFESSSMSALARYPWNTSMLHTASVTVQVPEKRNGMETQAKTIASASNSSFISLKISCSNPTLSKEAIQSHPILFRGAPMAL